MGVDLALVGRSAFQSSLPLLMSNARTAGSSVPAINTNPPAVTIGPPSATEPHAGGAAGATPIAGNWPSGTLHRNSAVSASIAFSVPNGGGVHGTRNEAHFGSEVVHRNNQQMAVGIVCGAAPRHTTDVAGNE